MNDVNRTPAGSTGHARRKTILLATLGSLGDLIPYLALGRELHGRGHRVLVATGSIHQARVESAGLIFHRLRPDYWRPDTAVARDLWDRRRGSIRLLRNILLPALRDSLDDLHAAADSVDLLVSHPLTYAVRFVAELRGLPWISTVLFPMGFFSAYDPSVIPVAPALSGCLRRLGPRITIPIVRGLKWISRSWAEPWHRLRCELSLPPDSSLNPLSEHYSPWLNLALYSPLLGGPQPDWPARTLQTGFPVHEQDAGGQLPDSVLSFLEDGPPPLVLTLGSASLNDARQFFEHSVDATLRLGLRAVLVTGTETISTTDLNCSQILSVPRVPFLPLFQRASLLVHAGGIGTCGLALRSGRPMLVVPCAHDQLDNAERLVRLGVARRLARERYSGRRVVRELQHLIQDGQYQQCASRMARQLQQEDGMKSACDAIEAVLLESRLASSSAA